MTELDKAATWLSKHFIGPNADLPFSFCYGKQSSAELLRVWPMQHSERKLDKGRIEHRLTWSDPRSELTVQCVVVEYCDFPTLEWVLHFENAGVADAPILSDIQAVDTWFHRQPTDSSPQSSKIALGVLVGDSRARVQSNEFVLHHQTGSPCLASDYQPFETVLGPNSEKRFTTTGGRSTNSDLPYFNLALPGEGVIVVIGWPGQWSAQFTRDDGLGLHVRAGQELTHFRLHPGETARSPSIVVQFYDDDWIRGQNIWRRWMVAHNMPRRNGQPPRPIASTCIDGQFPGYRSTAKDQLSAMDECAREGLYLSHWWIDAGWYPCTEWAQTGTWKVDRTRYPQGIREVFDSAHSREMQTVLWFEPERVRSGAELDTDHPEWLLRSEGRQNQLLHLGNAEARAWITDRIDRLINDEGVDLYRQDFNFDPLDYWHAQDATEGSDRQGITEIHYVSGYLAFWDELRRRHPNMLIDSCASGGRRNDIETLRRSVPLLQSDYRFEPVSQQCHNYGISLWMPYHGTGTDQTEPNAYVFRSHGCSAMGYGWDLHKSAQGDVGFAQLRRLVDQWRAIADYYLGDYYPLTPYSLENDVWMAWQYDCPEIGEGFVQAFRRAECVYESARFKLRGLTPDARYAVTNVDTDETIHLSGRELLDKGVLIALTDQPGSAIMTYKRSDKHA